MSDSTRQNIRKDLEAIRRRFSEKDFASKAQALRQRKYATETRVFNEVLRQLLGQKRVRAAPKTHAYLPQQDDDDTFTAFYDYDPPQKQQEYGFFDDFRKEQKQLLQHREKNPLPPPPPKRQPLVGRPSLTQSKPQDRQLLRRAQQEYLADLLTQRLQDLRLQEKKV